MSELPTVVLSEVELWKLERLATWRNDPKLTVCPRVSLSGRDMAELHYRGVISEYAVSLYFHEPMDLFIDLHGDNNVTDLIIANMTTSVKCPLYLPPILKFDSLEEFHQQVAVLTSFEPPNVVRLHGWITPGRFKKIHKVRDFGRGERVIAEVGDLWHVTSLKAIVFDRWKCGQLGGRLVPGVVQ